jgi:hypothetical protein
MDKINALAEASHQRMLALLDELRHIGSGRQPAKYRQRPVQRNGNAGPEEMEAEVVTFEEHSEKFEAMDLEANPEVTEAVVERQELRERLVVRRH